MSIEETPNFDRALAISMATSFLGIFASINIGLARFEISLLGSLLLSTLVALGTIILGLWVGVLKLLIAWFKREGDPSWVVVAMPLVGFGAAFVAMSALWWLTT